MPLERLLDGEIRHIDALRIPEQKPQANAIKLYRQLQRTDLWQSETQQWILTLNRDQTVYNPTITSDHQLLGIFVEGLFNREGARERLENFKMTSFYDTENQQWQFSMNSSQRQTQTQLLGVIAEGMFELKRAQALYDSLKQSPFYDDENQQWKATLDEDITNKADHFYTEIQLLDLLVVGMFDKEQAQEQFEKMKETEVYNSQSERWYQSKGNRIYMTCDQLIGILVEHMFNKEKARELYQHLKQTEFYDITNEQWKFGFDFGQSIERSWVRTKEQLLGVWIEGLLEGLPDERKSLVSKDEDVPVVRRF